MLQPSAPKLPEVPPPPEPQPASAVSEQFLGGDATVLLRQLLASSGDCVKLLHTDGRLSAISPGARQLLCVDDPTSLLNTNWIEWWSGGEERDKAAAALAAARSGGIGRFTAASVLPDGRTSHWDVVITAVTDPAAPEPRLLVVSRDVTARVLVEQERYRLDAERERLRDQHRLVLSAASMGWWHVDPATQKVRLDAGCQSVCDIQQEYVEFQRWLELIHPDERVAVSQAVTEATRVDDPRPYSIDYRTLLRDGTYRWVHAQGKAYFASVGKPFTSFVGTVADTTAARAAEQTRRASEARLQQLADAMPQIVFSATRDGTLDYFNRRWYDFTGLPPVEYLDEAAWAAVIEPADRSRLRERWDESIASGAVFETELRLRRATDTAFRWHLGRAVPVRDRDGHVERWFGTLTDIHDAKTAHEAELQARQQMELVVRGANVGVWYCPLPFDELIWDEAAKSHFHLPPDARVTIDTFYERMHPDDRDATRSAIAASLENRTSYEVDYRTVASSGGNTKWIRAIGRGFYDAAGHATRFDGITVDVTAQVNAEAALRQSEQRLGEVVRTALDAVVGMDHRGHVNEWNPAAERIFGYSRDDAIGREMARLIIPPEYREAHRKGLSKYLITGDGPVLGKRLELEALRADDTRFPVELTINRLAGTDPPAFTAFLRDITDRKRAETQREAILESERNARAEAERVSRMKDEFLATLSHELRTPLNAILGWAQIISTSGRDPADVEQGLDVIERNARAQSQIIEDLLDMSRIVNGTVRLEMQPLELRVLLNAAIDTAKPAAAARMVKLVPPTDRCGPMPLRGDAARLQQVLWNLLSNAIKFTPAGGRVAIDCRREESTAIVIISDSGEGIDATFLPHVFDRFRQADGSTTRRHGGLGLGLSIVKQLVELHGGTIDARSEGPGRGSSFTIRLPLIEQPPVPARPRRIKPSAPPPDLAGLCILVVDDEADARHLVRRILQDAGATVALAVSAAEAAARIGPDIHLLISDLGMPDEDGFSLIARLRAAGTTTPAMALSAYARPDDRAKSIAAGFTAHLPKPINPLDLLLSVAALTQKV